MRGKSTWQTEVYRSAEALLHHHFIPVHPWLKPGKILSCKSCSSCPDAAACYRNAIKSSSPVFSRMRDYAGYGGKANLKELDQSRISKAILRLV